MVFIIVVYLQRKKNQNTIRMATYAITLNESTRSGKALMSYLQELGVLVQKLTPSKQNSYLRSQADKRAGRIEKFDSAEEMFQSLGI